MHIDIAQRLHPYSHKPGTWCLIPGTTLSLQVFPSQLNIYDLSSSEPVLIEGLPIAIQGPVHDFTVTLDLERGFVRVEGKATQGFFRYMISALLEKNALGLTIEKSPIDVLFPKLNPQINLIDKNQIAYTPTKSDRLSLGNHKAQDWDLVARRQDLGEIFPFWLRLGQLIPILSKLTTGEGTTALFKQCEESMISGHPEQIFPSFKKLFLAGFFSMLIPRLHDDEYQGIVPPMDPKKLSFSPLILLQKGADLIRQLFVDQRESNIHILPFLPPELHCGRFLHVVIDQKGLLDLEWSKKTIRRMIFYSAYKGEVLFRFNSDMKQFRLRTSEQDAGQRVQCGAPIKVECNQTYFFDKFQK